jgi:hypothetical protein
MTVEKAAYLSIFDNYKTGCGYDMADWLKARDMARNSRRVRDKKAILLTNAAEMKEVRKRVLND